VLACPPGAMYRMQKAVRRNKLAFAAGAGIALALIAGIVVSSWQAVRATRAEHRALGLQSDIDYDRNLYRDLWQARGYETTGQTNQAYALRKDLYPRLAKSFPAHREDCLGVARSFVRAEQFEEAKEAYDAVRQSLEADLPGNSDDFEK